MYQIPSFAECHGHGIWQRILEFDFFFVFYFSIQTNNTYV